ncbi:MAG: AAA family ATPase, partial [Muribaculaceae bacterium]
KNAIRYFQNDYPTENIPVLSGGKETNAFLQDIGFNIIPKQNSLSIELQKYINQYKRLITENKSYKEIYKWEAISRFKENWNLNSQDLVGMFEESFPGNNNLWSSNNYYPIAMLKGFSETNSEGVKKAFTTLFDEDQDLTDRILYYKNSMDSLLKEDNQKRGQNNKHHYQDGRTIALFLSFNEPTKYFLFKYTILKSFNEKFSLSNVRHGNVINQLLVNQEINTRVKEILLKDKELLDLHNNRLTEKAFTQDDYNLLTQDFIYSIITYLKESNKYYLVGAFWDDAEPQDQTERFLNEKFWQNGYSDKFTNIVNGVPKGAMIAIKTVDRKNNKLYIKAIGKVLNNPKNGQYLDVDWIKRYKNFIPSFSSGGFWDTITEIIDKEKINEVFFSEYDDVSTDQNYNITKKQIPLNTILYGPPGTGKTYNTIKKALEIIDGDDEKKLNWEDRRAVKELFDKRVEENRIVFTTFHQSMSYEDFIEGIKPITKKGEIRYKVKDGIFKKLCYETFFNIYSDRRIINENELFKKYNERKKIYESYTWDFESQKEFGSLDNTRAVLIIDEINRGNVSQIFGELLTTIEQDKRIGEAEALEVILPYSKEKFGVPPNLYIIGTMNTADRSVEALDTALRRRFSFEEKCPLYNLKELDFEISGNTLNSILSTINSRIEKLLDKDHQIGHSYFLNKNTSTLIESFYSSLIPLLQEYFFGDYGKIGMIMGKGFVKLKEADEQFRNSFADFECESSGDFDQKEIFSIVDYRNADHGHKLKFGQTEVDMNFEYAVKLLMNNNLE